MISRVNGLAFAITSAVMLSACGGGSSSDGGAPVGDSNSGGSTGNLSTYSGSLVIPQSVTSRSARAIQPEVFASYSSTCPNVPDGYEPMANATVAMKDADGNQLGESTTSDTCGLFKLQMTQDEGVDENSVISASLAGYKELKAHAQNFEQGADDVSTDAIASTIPASATYLISAIQKASGDELMFSVTDTVSNNAVIQLTKAAFKVSVNNQPLTISSLNTSDQLGVASSNVISLDASGSMFGQVRDENGDAVIDSNGYAYTLHRLTALAAHQFISEKSSADEIGVMAFDSSVELINNALLAQYNLYDENDADITFDYSDENFVIDKAKLHFAVDMYNPTSPLWMDNFYDAKHTGRTDNVDSIGSGYRWGGGTELEGAINDSLTALQQRSNAIKRTFVMTDGNSSFDDRQALIDTAVANSIPVHAIAVGAGANETDLKVIANQTGGTYYKIVDGQNLVGIYSSLQTTIKYAYLAKLNAPLQAGDEVKLSLEINGETVERTITLQ
ncbi:vWA domain-containing protein [Vibrio sp. NH-7]